MAETIDFKFVSIYLRAWLRRKAAVVNVHYRRTVATWTIKPTFRVMSDRYRRTTDKDMIVNTGANPATARGAGLPIHPARLHAMIDRGTDAHDIPAKNAPFLVFAPEFTPKTRQGFIGSGTGWTGSRLVQKKMVSAASGNDIEPRNWTIAIVDMIEAEMVREIGGVLSEAIRKGSAGPG